MNWLFRMFSTVSSDPLLMDHIPTRALEVDWRDEAVKRAAERYGSAFKCGPASVPRERFVGKELAKEVVKPKATVTELRRKK